MKKLILPLIGIYLLLANCKSQDHKPILTNKQNATNKKLDEKVIKTLLRSIEGKTVNDTLFVLGENYARYGMNTYVYLVQPVNKNFKKIFVYDKHTLMLKNEGTLFVSIPIGVYKFYDEKGNLIKEIDYEKGFENFTITDLLLKIKKEFKIDLNDEIDGMSVSREIRKEDKIPIYIVRIPITIDSIIKIRFIGINGISGNIVYDRVVEDVQWGDD